ncbi:hypothetical protein QAD02_006587 [Eretmocerus hayati]|uniref:Uncharacterized protein n=1 Tax=Eretmocerus hayati TaxID=131215 RepID=A0ACC2N1A7_9HYME|nr:hypothetical protein QAD02_006587 [Eretmocerus hayati]
MINYDRINELDTKGKILGGLVFSIFVVGAIYLVISSIDSDYCNITSCYFPSSHTMCRYSKPSIRCTAGGDLGGGLDYSEKQALLRRHNQLRQKVASGLENKGSNGPQPAAKSMPNLVWDAELSKIAQRWADQCNFSHDQCRNVDRFHVGQNIAISGTTGDLNSIRITSLVDNWYEEVKDYDGNDVATFGSLTGANGGQIGHYTQLVWAKTTTLGCGARKFSEDNFKKYFLVCNYGPAGNVIGQPVYERK